jgi:acyl transferase domain-containing protein/thioesterase domain-containing protein
MSSPQETEQPEGIAVIGMAGRFPGAANIEQFWKSLCDAVESVTPLTDEQLLSAGVEPSSLKAPNYVKAGVLLDGIELFDARFFGFSPREAELTDPQHRIFLECAWEALEDAGYVSDRTKLRIGVFAGAGTNNYFACNLVSIPDLMRSMDDLQKMIVIDKDYLATRVSYKLNLKGPSIAIQTACSTSLVCAHLACQSLLNGECDIALAGGVSIKIPQIAGYLYQEGSILSPDGHCRAFDAAAKGTVGGSGAGIVVLKRLPDALAGGDCIRAVIRSSAVNNDGAAKIGYTAPSVDGQATVISEAQALAGVTADEITYVETHGTGTSLGDPIEVAALTKAFRRTTQNRSFCAIGSLKTNIGHLDAAAGVAGLIKTVLALENRTLPPSLNFKQPNPNIDFANSPFYVQQTLSEWQSANGRRVAGVSSFGIGGTNAHVIVEEAPPAAPSDQSRPWQLLPISAKTREALEKATDRLGGFLTRHRGLNLADVAFTLQQGRKAFVHRRILAAKTLEDAIELLQTRNPRRVHSGRAFEGDASVAFMFPAQGTQHVNMGRDLYETEPVFREHLDRCVAHLQPRLGLDLRRLLYPDEKDAEQASEQLKHTRFTQPAVFTVDYALAQLWISWGITPAAMVGHSLGEYVAATLSGVFHLEDALTLVAERARLMQELPPGGMLAVHLSEEELQPWVREGISLAAVNAPGLSVASGPVEAIERLAEALRAKHVEAQPLQTSHAFHSAMMEPMIAPFVERIRQKPRRAPEIPFISSLTGTWITADQATDPAYWGRQTRYGVRFSPAVAELLKAPGRVLLEVGPGNTLSTLAKLHLRGEAQRMVVPSLRHVKEDRPDHDCMLTALGCLWMAGVTVDWKRLYTRERRRRVALPTYPFERQRFWIEARPVVSSRLTDSGRDKASASACPFEASERVEDGLGTSSEGSGAATTAGVSFYSRPDLPTEYMAPQTETERALARLWQEALGVKQIGIHDDFFELGGHSLLALTLLSDVERVFGKRAPLASLIQAPTIHQFSEDILRKDAWAPSWSSLVPIQPRGSTAPLFLVHGAEGNVLLYTRLARHLGSDQPVYGLQSQGLNGDGHLHASIEEMASHYVKELIIFQPDGPYFLGGYCLGGTIALEMAQQLSAQGKRVGLVVMMDTYNVNASSLSKSRRLALCHLLQNVWFHGANFFSIRTKDRWNFLSEKLEVARARLAIRLRASYHSLSAGGSSKTQKEYPHLLVKRANDRAVFQYVPRPYCGRVAVMRSKGHFWGLNDPRLGWGSVVRDGLEIREMPVYLRGVLVEPFVRILAEDLKVCLQNAQSGL